MIVPTSGKALASLVLGVLGGFWITAILALIFGYQARTEIRQSQGRLAGDELARAGIILGWVYAPFLAIFPILIIAAIAIPNLLQARQRANEASAVGSLRTINTACEYYANQSPDRGFPDSLEEMGPGGADLIDSVLASGRKNGYVFTYEASDTDQDGILDAYSASAAPIDPGRTGKRFYFTDETGVIRLSED
ncbi:MAG: DUF4190 domain-containing protein, partial [Candidatus Acidiferrales bacterium]